MKLRDTIVGAMVMAAFILLIFWLNSHDDVTSKMHTDYSEVTIHYKGHPLYCVAHDHGLSCDWQRWHQETAPAR